MTKKRLHDEVAPLLLSGLDGAEAQQGERLLDELLVDWLREAGSGDDASATLAILKDDLERAQQGRTPTGRLALLRELTLERRLRRLGIESFDLGMRVLEGKVDEATARSEGEALMGEVSKVAPELRALDDSEAKSRLQRELQEISMEALYAIERQGMSRRLNNAARDLKDDAAGPPSVH